MVKRLIWKGSGFIKKIGADTILAAIVIPIIAWFFSFVFSTYSAIGEVSSVKDDIKEIKRDVRDINKFLREKPNR